MINGRFSRYTELSGPAAWCLRIVAIGMLLAGCALPPERLHNSEPPQRVEPAMARPHSVLREGDLQTFNLRMDATDGRVLFEKDYYDKSSFPVVLEIDGQQHAGVVEVLGSSSRLLDKKSILVKLDKGQEWQGQRRLALDAMANDASMIRERLAWDTIHALGMVAPAVHYRRIEVNGKYVGLFLQTEWIQPSMFERFGLGADGQFYTPDSNTYCGDFSSGDADRVQHCWIKLAPRDGDFQSLSELSQAVADTPIDVFDQFLDRHFNADLVINWILVNTLTSNGDTYNKNFFFYRSSIDERWTVVPFDYDLAFGRNFDPFLPYPQNIFNDHFVYYYPPELGAPSPLKEKVLRNPRLRERFMARMRHVLGLERGDLGAESFGLWHPDIMGRRIEELGEIIRPYALSDLYRDISSELFEDDLAAVDYFTRARWHYLVTKLFGTFPWDPELSFWGPGEPPPPPPLPANLHLLNASWPTGVSGDNGLAMISDGYGYILALLDDIRTGGSARLDFLIDVDMASPPEFTPPGVGADQCVQRTWSLTLKTPLSRATADLTLEYLQENSHRNELGSAMGESRLSLWLYEDGQWRELPTLPNQLANTLTVEDLEIRDGRRLRFVACSSVRLDEQSE